MCIKMSFKTRTTVKHHCEICNKNFISNHNLTRHKKLHKNKEKASVQGKTENEVVIKAEKSNSSIKSIENKNVKIQKPAITIIKQEYSNKPRNYSCSVCKKSFVGKNDLRKHYRIHTNERPYVCNVCGSSFRQAGCLKNHIQCKHSPGLQSAEIFVCQLCDKPFLLKDRLKLHLRTHTKERPYKCTECSKTFARGGQLQQHLRTHTKDKPYACKLCDAAFTCGANLKAHVNRHLDIRQFVCDICGKAFYRKDALRKHLNCTHGNLKPFKCKICKKTLKGHLPQHMRTHSKNKPFGCAHCGLCFTQKSQLTVHQRIHSGEKPYRCQVCWKAFAHSTALKLHIRRHTGEKPFLCFKCNVGFSQVPHLKKHMLCIHKSNKPYYCEFCKKFFKSKNELLTHKDSKCKKKRESALKNVKNEKVDTPMSLGKMRLLLAVLIKKISTAERLNQLGFDKRLIDDILVDSIIHSGREPCEDKNISVAETLKRNIQILLDWTIPEKFREKFKNEQRSTEELLEELTS